MESTEGRSFPECNRLPTLEDIERVTKLAIEEKEKMRHTNTEETNKSYILYDNYINREESRRTKKDQGLYSYCILSVIISFVFGLSIGIILVGGHRDNEFSPRKLAINNTRPHIIRTLNSLKDNDIKTEKDDDRFAKVSFTGNEPKYNKEVYPKGLTDDMKDILKDNKINKINHSIKANVSFVPNESTVLYQNIFWGPEIENAMPQGYGEDTAEIWEKYIDQSEVVKMEVGCGRMQNRLVTFRDGVQACVRYRQNTDQIQGEIFSFYVGRLLNLTNLAPSVVKVVDLKDKLWSNVANDIAAAQWSANRAVVLTQYIPSLDFATIPEIFKPADRHLNKIDVMKMSVKENDTVESKQLFLDKLRKNAKTTKKDIANFNHINAELNRKTINLFVELAQWSDLIIFDYLTANLDRIVNNLFNFQWNVNIMDGPAHNLAKKIDSGLLLFLDNESGLLHGYRLLKKYNVYHNLMLDNLCVFRKRTIDSLRGLHESSVGGTLSRMFHGKNSAVIRDILPPLPEKNGKILHERIGKVLSQVEKCQQAFR